MGGHSDDVARHPDAASAPGVGGVEVEASVGDVVVLFANLLFW